MDGGRMKCRNVIVVLFVFFTAVACSQPAYPYSAGETYSIMNGNANEEMRVVENNNKAGNIFLHEKAMKVPYGAVTNRLIERMQKTVSVEKGVGIAAPQVGISRQLVLVQRFDRAGKPFFACLNPIVKQMSKETKKGWEGCLSVPAGFGEVVRSKELTIVCHNADGVAKEETISGFTAVIFQHELDHLNGVLFVDRMNKNESLIPKDEYRKMRKKKAPHPEKK